MIARALREAPTGHRYDRVLTAKMTAVCVLVGAVPRRRLPRRPGEGVRLPGLWFRPGTEVPADSAFSQARRLLAEQAMRKIFELDAARSDAELGITALWKGLEVTAIDGTTMELFRNDVLACEFGTPTEGARPLLRIAAYVRTAGRRWIGAGSADTTTARTTWPTGWMVLGPGMLDLADRVGCQKIAWSCDLR